MIVLAFFSWWYGRGWKQVIASFVVRTNSIANAFSVSTLLRTLFAPWRRIVTPPGASLGDKLHAIGDNMVSRAIGFVVRFFVLLTAFLLIIVVAVLTAIEIVIWPFIPPSLPVLLVMGVTG